jgi:hypothetical protein
MIYLTSHRPNHSEEFSQKHVEFLLLSDVLPVGPLPHSHPLGLELGDQVPNNELVHVHDCQSDVLQFCLLEDQVFLELSSQLFTVAVEERL